MVVSGRLVKEDCSNEAKARMGTIVKVSDIIMHENSPWQVEVDKWKSYNSHSGEPNMAMCSIIRPGKVASVRWQDDPTKLTVHVFYNDCKGNSNWSYGSNSVEVVGCT